MDFKKIVLYAVIVIILYLVYTNFFVDKSKKTLLQNHNALMAKRIAATSFPGNSGSNDFCYSFWVYINDWNHKYGSKKVIMERRNDDGSVGPSVYLGENTNTLNVELSTYSNDGGADTETKENVAIPNIPLQKWTHIVVTSHNRAVDVYVDGKLVKTHVLDNVLRMDKIKETDLSITPNGGFSGYISQLRYFSRSVNPREAYDLYKQGNGEGLLSGLLNKYKIKLSFIIDNDEKTALII